MYCHYSSLQTIQVAASVAVDTAMSSIVSLRRVDLEPMEALWVTPTAQEEQ